MFGKLLQASLSLAKTTDQPHFKAIDAQQKQLVRLLSAARKTAFGKHHDFGRILKDNHPALAFQRAVPATEYDLFFKEWLRFSREDEPNITWPGAIPYYALSSGTAGASSKYLPVTEALLDQMKKGTRRMFFDLSKYPLPDHQLQCKMLMVGSCTALKQENGHLTGDLSGIIGLNRPLWMSKYYRPGRQVTDLPDWSERIAAITRHAHQWNIGFVVGNPAWVQMVFEQIIRHYDLQSIHDIWPNLRVFVHGGVFIEPYLLHLEQLFNQPVHYIDSYMASEGFFAYRNRPGAAGMRLLADCGVYFEFVPVDATNFDEEGNLLPNATVLTLEQVEEQQQYAMLVSTCAGLWRYLIGDTIQFTDLSRTEFRITGRTRQFLSVCGEHLSIDNLNEAVRQMDLALNAGVVEFAVAGIQEASGWVHQWYIGVNNPHISPELIASVLDLQLCRLNDDYAVERQYAIHEVRVKCLPVPVFYEWLHQRGKLNGQAKIPRVLKGATLEHWQQFVDTIVPNTAETC